MSIPKHALLENLESIKYDIVNEEYQEALQSIDNVITLVNETR